MQWDVSSFQGMGSGRGMDWCGHRDGASVGRGAATVVLGCLFLVGICVPGSAAEVALGGGHVLDVAATIGTGADAAYLVVDFGNNGGAAYAVEYRFDGRQPVVAQDAWLEVVDQTELEWVTANYGSEQEPNLFVDAFRWGLDEEAPDFGVSAQSWAYWEGRWDAGQAMVAWSAAQVGMRDRMLMPGSWDGWRVTSYDPSTFEPLSPPMAPVRLVPEPAMTWHLVWVSLMAIAICGRSPVVLRERAWG